MSTDSSSKKRIIKTLKGPVSVILSGYVAELSGIQKLRIYDYVLSNLSVLSKSISVLRNDRKRFQDVLVTADGKFVEDDVTTLSCGRNLAQVIGMIIRSATKRYFHSVATSPTPLPHLSTADEADQLYETLRDYLMHDWQVSLVPTYAEMTPAVAREICEALPHIRDVTELRQLIERTTNGEAKPEPVQIAVSNSQGQSPSDSFSMFLSLDGKNLRIDAFDDILKDRDVQANLGKFRIKTVLSFISGPIARLMIYCMGLTSQQFLVIMSACFEAMGKAVFSRIMGNPGEPELIKLLSNYGKSRNITSATPLPECVTFIRDFMDEAQKKNKAG